MLGCDEVARLLSDWEDGALPLTTRLRLHAHLAMCAGCRSLERSLRATLTTLRALGDEPLGDEQEK